MSTSPLIVYYLPLFRWVGEVPSEGVAFLTAGIQLIIVRNDVVAYGSSNVLIPDVSIDDVINQTFTCRAVLDLQVFEWTTTIIPPRTLCSMLLNGRPLYISVWLG